MDKSYQFDGSASFKERIKSSETNDKDLENKELTKRVRAALDQDPSIRKANIEVSTKGSKAVIEGTIENIWDMGKVLKIASGVVGVDGVETNLNVE